jgi:hypothetical protein
LDVLKLEELIAKRREEELVVSHQVDAIRLEIAELQARRESEAAASKKKLRIHKLVIRRDMAVGQLPLATSEISSIVPAPSVLLQPKVGELIIEPNATTPAGDAEDVLLDEVMQSVEEVSQLVAMEDQLGDTEEQSFSAFTEEALVDDAWSFVLGNGS